MRWSGQELESEEAAALPGLVKLSNLVRSVTTPEFAGVRFHEVLAKTALNRVPGESAMPFHWTVNPYRGCSHACVYCLGPESMILMGDGSQKPIWDVRVGDRVYGTRSEGRYRRYVQTTVLAQWSTRKPAFRVTLADGTNLIASADHRFLTDRGWKHVTGSDLSMRPHLTTNNKLMGFGTGGLEDGVHAPVLSEDYRRGYLSGMIRGDGHVGSYSYGGEVGARRRDVHRFRLALVDSEALHRSRMYLAAEGIETSTFTFAPQTQGRRMALAIRTSRKAHIDRIRQLMEFPVAPSRDWCSGFLGGIFDAEGSHSQGVLRISNSDTGILNQTRSALDMLGIAHATDVLSANGVTSVRVVGGLPARQRFFRLVGPSIVRKQTIDGVAVKTKADLRVVSVEPIAGEAELFDLTTGTGDFIANGVISHNCFARNTHTYLDLDSGKDFDSEVIVKVNVGEVLARELVKPRWMHEPVALGTNTDPYQRAEGRYRLMPGIIAALTQSGTPFSVLTKGTLLRRDLPLLAEAAGSVPVDIAMSIAVYDDELQQSLEPGTPSTAARLATVKAVREAGLDCTVFMMPVIPHLTDSRELLDRGVRMAKDAGATSLLYTSLHLRPGAREWFMQWLEREHPELVGAYRTMYGSSSYAPKGYREWLAARMRPILRAHGMERSRGVQARPASGQLGSLVRGELPVASGQLTLF